MCLIFNLLYTSIGMCVFESNHMTVRKSKQCCFRQHFIANYLNLFFVKLDQLEEAES